MEKSLKVVRQEAKSKRNAKAFCLKYRKLKPFFKYRIPWNFDRNCLDVKNCPALPRDSSLFYPCTQTFDQAL
jgi:hypothetical protein